MTFSQAIYVPISSLEQQKHSAECQIISSIQFSSRRETNGETVNTSDLLLLVVPWDPFFYSCSWCPIQKPAGNPHWACQGLWHPLPKHARCPLASLQQWKPYSKGTWSDTACDGDELWSSLTAVFSMAPFSLAHLRQLSATYRSASVRVTTGWTATLWQPQHKDQI